jgi:malonyl-CoA O-methyltransferase
MANQYLPVKDLYDEWAGCYDTRPNPLTMAEGKILRKLLGNVKGKKILDVGCGTGRHAIALAKDGASVTGVDFAEAMLVAARAKADGLDVCFLAGELQSIPLQEQFDVVLCSLVFNHVEDLVPGFQEMSRLVRPGGRIIVTDLRTDLYFRKARVIPLFNGFATDSFKHTLADYEAAIRSAGLDVRQRRGIRFDSEIIAMYPSYFYLWFFSVGYAFEICKAEASDQR